MPTVTVQDISLAVQKKAVPQHRYFLHVLSILFLIWALYRYLFVGVPIFIDETLGKMVFFALPVWLYVILTQAPLLYEELSPNKMFRGIFLGIAFGGLFGFIGTAATLTGKSHVVIASTFLSISFWWQFFLGVFTAFWESIFFFGWVFATLQLAFPKWNLVKVSLFNMLVFLLFHIPNTLIRFDATGTQTFQFYFFGQLCLLGAFALGQGMLFYRYKNLYLLTMTHAIWGMVLLVFSK